MQGKLIAQDAALHFDSGDFRLKLTDEQSQRLKSYEAKAIVMGIRPEDLYDSRHDSMAEAPRPFQPVCDLVEPLGNEFHVVLKTDKHSFVAPAGPQRIAKSGSRPAHERGHGKSPFL
ncbi:MAG: hypothetical protein LRZ88_07705 [Candidatus Cloacimonetes bacterium]|nr:hypothetical protein [Candidatus Cloacimonadota bacterium]